MARGASQRVKRIATPSLSRFYTPMGRKRQSSATETTEVQEATSTTQVTVEKPAKRSKKKVWEPFDPTVPNNMSMPTEMSFPKIPENAVKIASYNVSGLNACLKKGFKQYIEAEDADIVCLQETKVNEPVSNAVDDKVYKYRYWSHADKKGYCKFRSIAMDRHERKNTKAIESVMQLAQQCSPSTNPNRSSMAYQTTMMDPVVASSRSISPRSS